MSNYSDLPINEIEEDYFNFKNYSKAISTTILESDTPVAMSISGDWGEGKTSLLNLIESELLIKDKNLNKHLFIKFDAWKFTFSDNLNQIFLNHVLSEIVKSDIVNNLNENDKKTILSSVISIAKIGGEVLGGYIKKKTDIEIDFSEIIADGGKFINNKLINSKNIREDFELIVNKILDKKGKDFKIIISIDDLDRIDSIKAIEIIEVFKNYLNVKGVFAILVIDQEIINNGLERKFDLKTKKEKEKYKKYFDKIIQIPFVIPNKSGYQFADHLNFLKNIFGKDFVLLFKKGDNGNILKELFLNKIFLKGNPRTIKKYYNIFRLLRNINTTINGQDLMFISILKDFEEYFEAFKEVKVYKNEYDDNGFDKSILGLIYGYEISKDSFENIIKLTEITDDNNFIWKDEILKLVDDFEEAEFQAKDFKIFENDLKLKFPNNNYIKEKIRQQIRVLHKDGFLDSLGNGKYKIKRVSENDLLELVLKEIKNKKSISTSEIKNKLSGLAKGKDAEIINGRNDTYYDQKIRNLVSHGTLEKYADGVDGTKKEGKKWTINKEGEKYLDNL